MNPSIKYFDSIKICLKNFANFKGRGRRSEFWPFCIIIEIINFIFNALTTIFSTEERSQITSWLIITKRSPTSNWFYVFLVIWLIIRIGSILPLLAASTRRLHDIGYSGYWNFLFLTVFGIICLIFFWCKDSTMGANNYGESTKYNFGINNPFLNNPNVNQILQNPIVRPGAYPQQYNPIQLQPNINQEGERINQNPEQLRDNQEEIPINKNPEIPKENQEQIEIHENQNNPIDNKGQIQINQNPQQPNNIQGQYIPIAQPNMYPQLNQQGQPQEQNNLIFPSQNPPSS